MIRSKLLRSHKYSLAACERSAGANIECHFTETQASSDGMSRNTNGFKEYHSKVSQANNFRITYLDDFKRKRSKDAGKSFGTELSKSNVLKKMSTLAEMEYVKSSISNVPSYKMSEIILNDNDCDQSKTDLSNSVDLSLDFDDQNIIVEDSFEQNLNKTNLSVSVISNSQPNSLSPYESNKISSLNNATKQSMEHAFSLDVQAFLDNSRKAKQVHKTNCIILNSQSASTSPLDTNKLLINSLNAEHSNAEHMQEIVPLDNSPNCKDHDNYLDIKTKTGSLLSGKTCRVFSNSDMEITPIERSNCNSNQTQLNSEDRRLLSRVIASYNEESKDVDGQSTTSNEMEQNKIIDSYHNVNTVSGNDIITEDSFGKNSRIADDSIILNSQRSNNVSLNIDNIITINDTTNEIEDLIDENEINNDSDILKETKVSGNSTLDNCALSIIEQPMIMQKSGNTILNNLNPIRKIKSDSLQGRTNQIKEVNIRKVYSEDSSTLHSKESFGKKELNELERVTLQNRLEDIQRIFKKKAGISCDKLDESKESINSEDQTTQIITSLILKSNADSKVENSDKGNKLTESSTLTKTVKKRALYSPTSDNKNARANSPIKINVNHPCLMLNLENLGNNRTKTLKLNLRSSVLAQREKESTPEPEEIKFYEVPKAPEERSNLVSFSYKDIKALENDQPKGRRSRKKSVYSDFTDSQGLSESTRKCAKNNKKQKKPLSVITKRKQNNNVRATKSNGKSEIKQISKAGLSTSANASPPRTSVRFTKRGRKIPLVNYKELDDSCYSPENILARAEEIRINKKHTEANSPKKKEATTHLKLNKRSRKDLEYTDQPLNKRSKDKLSKKNTTATSNIPVRFNKRGRKVPLLSYEESNETCVVFEDTVLNITNNDLQNSVQQKQVAKDDELASNIPCSHDSILNMLIVEVEKQINDTRSWNLSLSLSDLDSIRSDKSPITKITRQEVTREEVIKTSIVETKESPNLQNTKLITSDSSFKSMDFIDANISADKTNGKIRTETDIYNDNLAKRIVNSMDKIIESCAPAVNTNTSSNEFQIPKKGLREFKTNENSSSQSNNCMEQPRQESSGLQNIKLTTTDSSLKSMNINSVNINTDKTKGKVRIETDIYNDNLAKRIENSMDKVIESCASPNNTMTSSNQFQTTKKDLIQANENLAQNSSKLAKSCPKQVKENKLIKNKVPIDRLCKKNNDPPDIIKDVTSTLKSNGFMDSNEFSTKQLVASTLNSSLSRLNKENKQSPMLSTEVFTLNSRQKVEAIKPIKNKNIKEKNPNVLNDMQVIKVIEIIDDDISEQSVYSISSDSDSVESSSVCSEDVCSRVLPFDSNYYTERWIKIHSKIISVNASKESNAVEKHNLRKDQCQMFNTSPYVKPISLSSFTPSHKLLGTFSHAQRTSSSHITGSPISKEGNVLYRNKKSTDTKSTSGSPINLQLSTSSDRSISKTSSFQSTNTKINSNADNDSPFTVTSEERSNSTSQNTTTSSSLSSSIASVSCSPRSYSSILNKPKSKNSNSSKSINESDSISSKSSSSPSFKETPSQREKNKNGLDLDEHYSPIIQPVDLSSDSDSSSCILTDVPGEFFWNCLK